MISIPHFASGKPNSPAPPRPTLVFSSVAPALQRKSRHPRTSPWGQATLESLFIMFLMFMLIAAIYQMFLIHNTIYQMAANAYYEAFKEARQKNKKDYDFTKEINKPLQLKNAAGGGNQRIPLLRFFQSGTSMQVNRKFWIGSGTKPDLLPDFSSAGSSRAGQLAQSPPCTGSCSCTMVDSDGDSHTVGEMQTEWIHAHPGQEPHFPHTRLGVYRDCSTCPEYLHFGLTSNCY